MMVVIVGLVFVVLGVVSLLKVELAMKVLEPAAKATPLFTRREGWRSELRIFARVWSVAALVIGAAMVLAGSVNLV